MTRTVSAASGETTTVDAMGRLREQTYAAYRRGEITEHTFIQTTASVMAQEPDAFMEWLDGYTMSRFGRRT